MEGKRNNTRVIIIILIVCLIFILLGIGIFMSTKDTSKTKNNKKKSPDNSYTISNNQSELDDTQIVENDNMKLPHCLDDICISDVIMYYADGRGRVTYTITNNSLETVSGYLKMDFGSDSLIVSYKDIKSKEVFETVSYFDDKSFENVGDYKLEKLDDNEKSKIIVSK